LGNNVAAQPRYRDAAVVLVVCAAIGAYLAIDIGARAIRDLPETLGTLVLCALMLAGAIVSAYCASICFKRAKKTQAMPSNKQFEAGRDA
jgi:hypothetical protein